MSQKRPTCHCGSQRFRRDAQTGRIVCEEGHILQGFVQESYEREIDTSHQHRARRLRKNKKGKAKIVSQNYAGDKARCLQFECAQVLLRQQVWTLIHHWNLPAELEVVARDLWGLFVTACDLPETFPGSHGVEVRPASPKDVSHDPDDEIEAAFSDSSLSEKEAASASDNGQSEEDGDEVLPFGKAKKRSHNATKILDPTKVFHAWYTLIILYLSCISLKVPIFFHDIIKLAEVGTLPYLHFIDSLPEALQQVLPPPIRDSLNPKVLPNLVGKESYAMSAWINRFVSVFKDFEISFPALEIEPLIVRCVSALLLPPWFKKPVKYLLDRLHADFTYSATGFQSDAVRGSYRRIKVTTSPVNTYLAPDALLAATCITCVKLIYGLDELERKFAGNSVNVSKMPHIDEWMAAFAHTSRDGDSDPVALASSMPEDLQRSIDSFLDQFVSSEESSDTILPSGHPTYTTLLQQASGEDDLLNGHAIAVYAANDGGVGSVPQALTAVLKRLTSLVGVSENTLLKCVGEVEKRMASKDWFQLSPALPEHADEVGLDERFPELQL